MTRTACFVLEAITVAAFDRGNMISIARLLVYVVSKYMFCFVEILWLLLWQVEMSTPEHQQALSPQHSALYRPAETHR